MQKGDEPYQRVDHRFLETFVLELEGFQFQEIGTGYPRIFILDCFWLARERGHKTKNTKLIVVGIGSTWVQLKRVNRSPSPTHSAYPH
ncbi:hypothetical protein H5410_056656 [Solanum commersonii]|uniref:Uncharacterized protein n=1 Tax=Solanum commersonii TaxID=4109 RepID=A0A9J5WLX9_SOLCO|nr:hypothetical protein H5410_056656 [Solanum commersonii]